MICKRNIYVLENDLLCNRALENGLTSTKKYPIINSILKILLSIFKERPVRVYKVCFITCLGDWNSTDMAYKVL